MKNRFIGMHSDFVGFSASLLCALHCAALPFLLTLAPLAGLQFLANPWVEYAFILLSAGIACYALIPGYWQHRKPLALVLVVIGFLFIGFAHSLAPEDYEAIFTPVGATIIALAHLINWKQVRKVQPTCSNTSHAPVETEQHA